MHTSLSFDEKYQFIAFVFYKTVHFGMCLAAFRFNDNKANFHCQ